MSWETRQSRLRTMLGASSRAFGPPENFLKPAPEMCFQVVACYMPPMTNDSKMFDDLCKKHGVITDGTPMMEIFETHYGELLLPEGYVLINGDGTTEAYEPVTEALYTTTDREFIKKMIEDDNIEEDNPLFDTIVGIYASAIENTFQGRKFRGTYADLCSDSAIMFQFVIQPYKLDLCKPEDIGKLKPITIIDDKIIHPAKHAVSDLNFSYS